MPSVPILSQLDPVHTPTSHFLKINLNIFLASTPGSPKWSLSFRLPHQNHVYASPLPHTRYMPRPSHSSRFYHPKTSNVTASYSKHQHVETGTDHQEGLFSPNAIAFLDLKPSDYYASLPTYNPNMNSELAYIYVLYALKVTANRLTRKLISYYKRFSSYRAVNSLLGYKNQEILNRKGCAARFTQNTETKSTALFLGL